MVVVRGEDALRVEWRVSVSLSRVSAVRYSRQPRRAFILLNYIRTPEIFPQGLGWPLPQEARIQVSRGAKKQT